MSFRLVKYLVISVLLGLLGVHEANAKPKKASKSSKLDTLVYLGADEDKLSPHYTKILKDNINDHHFRWVHKFKVDDELIEVTIYDVKEDGSPHALLRTRDVDSSNRMLCLVEIDGKALNEGRINSLGKLSGHKVLDIYGFTDPSFDYYPRGKTFQVELLIRHSSGIQEKLLRQVTL